MGKRCFHASYAGKDTKRTFSSIATLVRHEWGTRERDCFLAATDHLFFLNPKQRKKARLDASQRSPLRKRVARVMWLRGCTPRINREEGRFRGSEMSGVVAYYIISTQKDIRASLSARRKKQECLALLMT